MSAPTTSASAAAPPEDPAAFRRTGGEILDAHRPALLVVENEENSAMETKAAALALVVAAVFPGFGAWLVLEIRSAQVAIWASDLPTPQRYLWFARLQTAKSIT
ncbi:MAG: hypothetical protein QN209_13205, partial [Armatimonadota bacterium]|nr:hypothetical protein [Armatimonadota bacterium]